MLILPDREQRTGVYRERFLVITPMQQFEIRPWCVCVVVKVS